MAWDDGDGSVQAHGGHGCCPAERKLNEAACSRRGNWGVRGAWAYLRTSGDGATRQRSGGGARPAHPPSRSVAPNWLPRCAPALSPAALWTKCFVASTTSTSVQLSSPFSPNSVCRPHRFTQFSSTPWHGISHLPVRWS